jgi:nucleotide-binding universal stress UspA family protein
MSIVVGYDESPGSDRALEEGIEMAQRFAAPLGLVFGARPPGGAGEEFAAHMAALEELGHRAMQHALQRAEVCGVPAEVEVVRAKPADALVEVADRRAARMIVVGSFGESPIRGALLGSTPHRLLRLSNRPVLVVPPGDTTG